LAKAEGTALRRRLRKSAGRSARLVGMLRRTLREILSNPAELEDTCHLYLLDPSESFDFDSISPNSVFTLLSDGGRSGRLSWRSRASQAR